MFKNILFSFAILVSSQVVQAQDSMDKKETAKGTSVVNLYGISFSFGMAPWVSHPKKAMTESEYFRSNKGNQFMLEAIPKGQTFEKWKTLYAVSAIKIGRKIPLKTWEDVTLNNFKKTCTDGEFKELVRKEAVSLYQVVCPKISGPKKMGYKKKMGEVGVFAFFVVDGVLISHYIEWRGKSFSMDNPKKWPVSQSELAKVTNLIKGAVATKGGLQVSAGDVESN